MATTVQVMIHPGPNLSVTPDSAQVYKKAGDGIEWRCASNDSFSVDFPNGSPFAASHFDNANSQSGPVVPDAEIRAYKYNVTVGPNHLDPQIIVKG